MVKIKIKSKTKKEKLGFFRRNYSLTWKYIKESRNYIWITLALFFIAIIFGFFNHALFADYIKKIIEQIINQTSGLNTFEMILFILQNNVRSAFIGFLLGMAIGIFPIFVLLLNGYVVGFVSYYAVTESGYSSLFSLLPHGIFEVPALIVSLALGIRLGGWILARDKKKQFIYRLKEGLRVFVFVIIPLLIIAAIIEGLLIGFLR